MGFFALNFNVYFVLAVVNKLQRAVVQRIALLCVNTVCSHTAKRFSSSEPGMRHPVDEQSPCNEQLKRSGHTENTKRLPLYLRQIWLTLISSAFPWRNPFTTALFAGVSFISPLSAGRDQGLLVSWLWSIYPACADIWHLEYLSKRICWLQTQSIWQKTTKTSRIIQGNLFLPARKKKNQSWVSLQGSVLLLVECSGQPCFCLHEKSAWRIYFSMQRERAVKKCVIKLITRKNPQSVSG